MGLQRVGHDWVTELNWWEELTCWKRPWCWERLRAGEWGNRGWDDWMVSSTQWTWVWANSKRQWRTGKPGVLQAIRPGHKELDTIKWLNNKNRLWQKWWDGTRLRYFLMVSILDIFSYPFVDHSLWEQPVTLRKALHNKEERPSNSHKTDSVMDPPQLTPQTATPSNTWV